MEALVILYKVAQDDTSTWNRNEQIRGFAGEYGHDGPGYDRTGKRLRKKEIHTTTENEKA
jgi:hypothetical protein